ncbi:hypothetical protein FACS1894176_01300 [Bacteroidia bacterium]|nr:hypothetical protein FACS1894176_01300 [Bacteroidia bacterium]
MPRVWKLQSVKTLPTFTLKVSGLPVDLGEVYAIFDDDGDFTSGATSIKLTNNNETTITAAQFKPYLTFATRIPDTEDPIVTLNGASTLLLYVGQTYTEQGANWTDNYDGTGTLSSPFSGSVTTTIAGTYTLSYQYTDQEGNPSAMVTRTVTVLPAPTTPTCTATPTATSGYVSILCTTIASGDILTIPNLTCTPSPSTGGNVTCIGTLLSSNPTATATNPAGPANNTVAVTLDTTAPTCSVSYSTTAPTNQSVIATLENCSESITVTSSGGYVHTFSSNGSFTFTFIDGVGNTGSILATVNTIDTIAPIGTISYDITIPTNGDVVASLSGNESIVVTNNGGSTDYTFTGNGTFTFQFRDLAGNTATAIAEVTWIDKSVIDAEISYSITGFTNQPVVATLTFLNESGVVIDNTSFDPCQGGETEVKV